MTTEIKISKAHQRKLNAAWNRYRKKHKINVERSKFWMNYIENLRRLQAVRFKTEMERHDIILSLMKRSHE